MLAARSGLPALVDERVEIPGRLRLAPPSPRLRDERQLLLAELCDGAEVLRRVDDDLLPLEGRVEIGEGAQSPGIAEPQRLGRRPVLAARAERALILGDVASAWPFSTAGRDGDAPAGERILAELPAQVLSPRSRNGVSRSIGAGKTIVVALVAPISSSVWR